MDTLPTYELHFLEHGPAEHVGHVLLLQVLEGLPDARAQVPDTLSHLHFPKGNENRFISECRLNLRSYDFKT
jgi:hypothetical protein